MYHQIAMSIKSFFGFDFFLFFFIDASVFSQSEQHYSKGAIFDEEAYSKLSRKAVLATCAYEGLPKSFSLKQYVPLPRDQIETNQNVLSPVYVYRNIRPDDPECQRDAQIYSALDLMRDSGAVRIMLNILTGLIYYAS
jgi:hypothetical protein